MVADNTSIKGTPQIWENPPLPDVVFISVPSLLPLFFLIPPISIHFLHVPPITTAGPRKAATAVQMETINCLPSSLVVAALPAGSWRNDVVTGIERTKKRNSSDVKKGENFHKQKLKKDT